MSEYLDVYNENMEHIGTETYPDTHRKALWHQTINCWIIHRKMPIENSAMIFQLRGANVNACPNLLDMTIGGHIAAGENEIDTVVREGEEEIGLKIDKSNLVYLGYYKDSLEIDNPKIKPFVEKTAHHVFFLEDNKTLSEYKMQEAEVDGVFEVTVENGLKLFSKEVNEIQIKGFERGSATAITKTVTLDNFLIRVGPMHYVKLFIMAERFLKGKKYLAV